MPAYQSIPEFALSEKYHLKAVCCEKCAGRASDQSTEQPRNGIRWQTKPRKCRMTLRGTTVGGASGEQTPIIFYFRN